MRVLATIDSILGIEPIPDADAIEQARVRGWTIVTKKGEFTVGDSCVYIEVDSALPMTDSRFEFLAPRGTKTLGDGKVVHVLRTAKLRGVYSQGLALPVDAFPELTSTDLEPGHDVAGLLGITLYEPPLPASTNGEIIGAFPTRFASKSDAERAQNLIEAWESIVAFGPWIATEKLDGSSVTVINDDGKIRACSRNYELAEGDARSASFSLPAKRFRRRSGARECKPTRSRSATEGSRCSRFGATAALSPYPTGRRGLPNGPFRFGAITCCQTASTRRSARPMGSAR
jgi:RNA ligase (TIGR02306 family)